MSFTESIKYCLANAVRSKGRGSRSEFWWFFLYYIIFIYVGILIAAIFDSPFVILLFFVALVYHAIALANAGIRRMHDTGMNGIFYFIPIVNLFYAVAPGDIDSNKYGEPASK